MRFILSAAATVSAIGISSAAPAATPAPAPAPAPVQYSAPAPSYAATTSSESEASRAPLAPVSDAIHFGNPARDYSIAEILETPHRWSGREAAAIEANAGDTTATGIAILDPFFVAFRNEDAGANPQGLPDAADVAEPTGATDGRLALGYMTPGWAAGLDLAFFQAASDPHNKDNAASASWEMDRIGLFGSLPYGDASIYGRADWVTGRAGSWSMDDHSSRDWWYQAMAGYRTYVPGSEGVAYNLYLKYGMHYVRLSGAEDPAYTNDIVLGFDYGTRRDRDRIVVLWGANSYLEYEDGLNDPDYGFRLSTQPNFSLEIPAFKYWTLKGGAAMRVTYQLEDNEKGDPSNIDRSLWTMEPEARLGLRYARSRWAAEADVTQLLAQGPYFLSGSDGAEGEPLIARFAITCDFGR